MAGLPHNIELSRFRRGQYVGYEASTGVVWRLVPRRGGGWDAYRENGPGPGTYFFRRTLSEVGKHLETI